MSSTAENDTVLTATDKWTELFAIYGYPVIRLVAALAVVWFSANAPS